MIHGGNHGLNCLSIRKGQNADLRPGEEFLNDNVFAALAEDLVRHHGFDGVHSLFPGLGNDHTLAQGQTVGLDDRGDGGGFQILEGGGHIVEHFIFRRGDAVLLHQILGEDLAALDDGGIGPGTEAGNALGFQSIHSTQHQRIVRSNDRIVDLVLHSKFRDLGNVRCPDGHADRVPCDAAVAGQGIDNLYGLIFFQLLDDGVLTTAAADYKDFHITSTFPLL